MAEVYNEPLATIGRRIHHTFKDLDDRITRDPCDISLENDSQRFELWAVNLGLYHLGHSSLDYRFRDAPSVFSFAYKLLQDLEKYLNIIKDTLDDELHQSVASQRTFLEQSDHDTVSPTTSNHNDDREKGYSSAEDSEDEESFDSYQAQPLVELAIENIAHVIDRLYRLSFKVRNPATRMGLTKAQAFRQIDQDTGVDLIHRFADYDRNHVEEVFRHYRPKLTSDEMANHFLAQRLAKANTRRRQQFGQWKRHKSKLQKGEKPAPKLEDMRSLSRKFAESRPFLETPLLGLPVPSQPSTATWLDQSKIALDDNTSVFSTSTYAIFSEEPDAELPVPQLPQKLREEKKFECPYCQVLCSRRTAEKQAWRTHVQRDLRPYVCTYSDCKEADQQYDSFKQWVVHETRAHGPRQRPPERRTNESPFQDSSQAHWEAQHMGNLDPSSQDSRQCPICLETPASFDHIGLHLWNIALFSLPRSMGIEEESDQGSTGSAVNERQSQDSRLTNMKDLESLSIEGEQEDNATAIADDRDNYEAAHLTIEALKDVPDSLQNGVAVNVSKYTFLAQTTGDEEERNIDHGSGSDSRSDLYISSIEERIRKAEETLKRYENTLGPEHMSTLDAIIGLAEVYRSDNRFVKAGTLYQRALSGYEKVLGPENVKTLDIVRCLGYIYYCQRRYAAAERLLQRALQSYIKISGPDDIETSGTAVNLGRVYRNQNRLTEAEGLFQRALKGCEKTLGIEDQNTMVCVQDLGHVYQSQGKLTEAEGQFQRALRTYEKLYGHEDREIIFIMSLLGFAYQLNDKSTEAEGVYQRALKKLDALKDFQRDSSTEKWTLFIANNLGYLYKKRGRLVEAEEMYQRARENEELIKARDTGCDDGGDTDYGHDDDAEESRSGDDGEALTDYSEDLIENGEDLTEMVMTRVRLTTTRT